MTIITITITFIIFSTIAVKVWACGMADVGEECVGGISCKEREEVG
tara:strand:- start:1179 stop:1316 length:138 start_codon:yes stop_codon:yes gene_type:complete